ncbi:MAG TPA: beta-ketoacyl-ACP synthase 3 [Thermoleophilaceae bacterium]
MLDVERGARVNGPRAREMRRGAAVASLAAVPGRLTVSNDAVAERLGVTEDWIVKRMGVRERRVAPPEESVAEMATEAARMALAEAAVDASAVDLILVATCTNEYLFPAVAAIVSAELDAPQAGTADVNAACNGFVSALGLAAAAIESGRNDCVLVVGADALSRWIDPDDRRTAPMFGDGAGAMVLVADDAPGRVGEAILRTDGSFAHLISVHHGGFMHMEGGETYRQAVKRLVEVTVDVVEAGGLELGDIDVFVYHQANVRILKAVGERLGVDESAIVNAMASVGNTSAASIPLALAAAAEQGKLVPGARVVVAGIGGGLAYGAVVLEWGAA